VMADPDVLRVDYEIIPNTGRVHVVLKTDYGAPIACGAVPRDFWPIGQEFNGAVTASIMLTGMNRCAHGGTYREPFSIWTGESR
jgi:hypothetical protein